MRCWLLVAGYWSLVTGRWLLVAGYWSLVTGCWSRPLFAVASTSNQQLATNLVRHVQLSAAHDCSGFDNDART